MNIKKWKPVCKKQVWNTYGKVYKITTKHIGVLLDLIIPCTFGAITYLIPEKEIMRLSKR